MIDQEQIDAMCEDQMAIEDARGLVGDFDEQDVEPAYALTVLVYAIAMHARRIGLTGGEAGGLVERAMGATLQ